MARCLWKGRHLGSKGAVFQRAAPQVASETLKSIKTLLVRNNVVVGSKVPHQCSTPINWIRLRSAVSLKRLRVKSKSWRMKCETWSICTARSVKRTFLLKTVAKVEPRLDLVDWKISNQDTRQMVMNSSEDSKMPLWARFYSSIRISCWHRASTKSHSRKVLKRTSMNSSRNCHSFSRTRLPSIALRKAVRQVDCPHWVWWTG